MRILISLAVLASTARAEPVHPQLDLGIGRIGAARVDGTSGMAVGFFADAGVRIGSTSAAIDVGIGWVCRDTEAACEGPLDISFAMHGRHRIGSRGPHRLWVGGGPAMHRISSVSPVAARGEIERTSVRWQPGLDLLLAIELRDRKGEPIGGHVGLRAFTLRSSKPAIMKSVSERDSHGIDGGLVLEVGYIYGR